MDMNSTELKAFAELVADIVECRLRGADKAEIRRQVLRDDIVALSEQLTNIGDVLKGSRRVLADHDLDGIGLKIDSIRELEPQPRDDIYEELKKLERKLRRLQDKDSYEKKLPWRHQINVDDLVSVLVEILDILRKLYRRSTPPEG